MRNFKVVKPYVFVVLEHAYECLKDAEVHGVYTTREIAEAKKDKLEVRSIGYVSVLKKPLKGPSLV